MAATGNPTNKKGWKAFQADYDYVFSLSDRVCSYCLTDQEVAALLSMTEFLKWPTRWVRAADDIDPEIILNFTEKMERRLMSGCCDDNLPIQYRYSSTGVLEISLNGGGSWTPAPEYDPRVYSPQFPPPAGADGDDKKCIAATGAAALIKEQVGEQLTDDMTRYTLNQLIVDWVKTYIQTSNPFQALLTVIANQIFALVIAVLRPALTDTVYDQFMCVLYCNMGDDATVNDAQWQAIRSDITAQIGGVAGIFLEHLVYLLGTGGLTNVIRAGGAATGGDCADCGCVNNCLSSGWKIYSDAHPSTWGTVIATDDDSITIQAIIVPSVGGYGAAVVKKNLGTLCRVSVEFPSGGVTFWGGNTDLTHIVLDGSGNPITIGNPPVDCNLLAGIATSPFTIKFIFSDVP